MSKWRIPESHVGDRTRWQVVEAALRAHFEKPDIQAAQILLACVAAHRIVDHPPVWAMLIAPSGSMKTALLDSLQGLPHIHFVDEVTQNTFISGMRDERSAKRENPASLLHRIGNDGIIVTPDFSTVLAMDNRKRPAILAQLRRIYDGSFSREFGTGENLSEHKWEGRITFLAGVTPEFDRQHSVFQALGERFVRTRWPRAGGTAAGIRAIQQHRKAANELCNAVHVFLMPIFDRAELPSPFLSPPIEAQIANLGELVARARAYVPRARETHEISDEPAPEGNTRLPQQLAQIARGWAALEGDDTVTASALELVRRVAFDCIPPIRCTILRTLMKRENVYHVEAPSVLISRAVDDLRAVGLLAKEGKTPQLSPLGYMLLEDSGVVLSPKVA